MGQRMTAPAGTITGYGGNTYSNSGNNSMSNACPIDSQLFKTTKIYVSVAGNSMDFQVIGSIDGGTSFLPANVVNSVTVAAGANNTQTVSSYYTNLIVQAKPTTGGQNGTMTIKWAGANF